MISDDLRDHILVAHLRGHPLHEIAAHHKVPLPDLAAWFKSPPIVALLDALESIADRQAALATAHARVTAINTLESAARGAEISDSEFRAASTLLRNTPKSPAARRHQSTHAANTSRDAGAHEPSARQEPRPAPHATHAREVSTPDDPARPATPQTTAPTGAHARDRPNS